jgi:hypothetical protein
MPLETVECLGMLVEADKNGWEILGWNNAPEKILSTAMRSGNVAARTAAIDLVHRLGALGHFQFRTLLSEAG